MNINLSLDRAFSKAMVFLPDESFQVVREFLDGNFAKTAKNSIYYHFRKTLIPETTVTYEDIKTKFIQIK